MNYHTSSPCFIRSPTGTLAADAISFPLRKMFKSQENFKFRIAEVSHIDTDTKIVRTDVGDFDYDYLVVATGATTNFFGNQEVAKYSLPMKSIREALNIRSYVLQNPGSQAVAEERPLHSALPTSTSSFVLVASYRVEGLENVFAIGDVSAMITEDLPRGLPGVAPVAQQQGKFVAHQIMHLLNDQPLENFSYFDKGSMATIGRNRAVVAYGAKAMASASFKIDKLPFAAATATVEDLSAQQGIGKGTAEKIQEIIQTGSFAELDQLIANTPSGLLDMLQIKGLGPKKILIIWQELGIESVGELYYACNENRLVEAKGFGLKSREDIKKNIEFSIANQDSGSKPRIHGSKRTTMLSLPFFNYRSGKILQNTLLETTGSELHIQQLGSDTTTTSAASTEAGIYQLLGLAYIEPELREGLDEIQKAKTDTLPQLITFEELKGTVHNHSTYSDGVHSLAEMARYCKENLGLAYFGICDHSHTATPGAANSGCHRDNAHPLRLDLTGRLHRYAIEKGVLLFDQSDCTPYRRACLDMHYEYPKVGMNPSSCTIWFYNVSDGSTQKAGIEGDDIQHYIPRMEWVPDSKSIILQQLNRKQNVSKIIVCDAVNATSKTIHQETDEAWIDIKARWNNGDPSGWDWINEGKEFIWLSEKNGWRQIL
ncbi:hypothetical protein FQR65_LT17351 [Abscondita terminalis]|nr:hypothetical protein FQR65_LT17351 [Abscondita terminalis]